MTNESSVGDCTMSACLFRKCEMTTNLFNLFQLALLNSYYTTYSQPGAHSKRFSLILTNLDRLVPQMMPLQVV
jgi:hypothetical protein